MKYAPFKSDDGKVFEAPDHEMWMRSNDNVHSTATELIKEFNEYGREWVDLACIGAGCVNTTAKVIAIARERIKRGRDLVVQPFFSTIQDEKNRERTRLMFRVSVVPRG